MTEPKTGPCQSLAGGRERLSVLFGLVGNLKIAGRCVGTVAIPIVRDRPYRRRHIAYPRGAGVRACGRIEIAVAGRRLADDAGILPLDHYARSHRGLQPSNSL